MDRSRRGRGPHARVREALRRATDRLVPGARPGGPDGQPHRLQRRLRGHHDRRPRHLAGHPAADRPAGAHRHAEPAGLGRLRARGHRARCRGALDRLRPRRGPGAEATTGSTSRASTDCCTAPCPSAAGCRRRRPSSRWCCWPSLRSAGCEIEPLRAGAAGPAGGERVRGRGLRHPRPVHLGAGDGGACAAARLPGADEPRR